jgi:hypothetical protein
MLSCTHKTHENVIVFVYAKLPKMIDHLRAGHMYVMAHDVTLFAEKNGPAGGVEAR